MINDLTRASLALSIFPSGKLSISPSVLSHSLARWSRLGAGPCSSSLTASRQPLGPAECLRRSQLTAFGLRGGDALQVTACLSLASKVLSVSDLRRFREEVPRRGRLRVRLAWDPLHFSGSCVCFLPQVREGFHPYFFK